MLMFAILAVFISGLMVGRTPEYLGKKIEQKEVKMALLAVIATAAAILVFTGISAVAHFDKNGYWNAPGAAVANINNDGPHGFSEMLYAYASRTFGLAWPLTRKLAEEIAAASSHLATSQPIDVSLVVANNRPAVDYLHLHLLLERRLFHNHGSLPRLITLAAIMRSAGRRRG